MKLTFAILEKYRDIIDFNSKHSCPLKIFRWCDACEFHDDHCILALEEERYKPLLKAFKQKYPELFI